MKNVCRKCFCFLGNKTGFPFRISKQHEVNIRVIILINNSRGHLIDKNDDL